MPNLFAIFLTSLLALSLSACKPEQIQEQLEQRLKAEGHIAPTIGELGLSLPALPNELVGMTAQAYKSPIQYTAQKSDKTYFYDKDGRLIDKPATDGYYRKILGVTADGRTVVQDFYANHAPQITPFILKQGADEANFDSATIDGDAIWFDKNGSIEHAFSHDSQWITIFKENQIIGQVFNEEPMSIVTFYPNTQNIMSYNRFHANNPQEQTLIYFYKNGNVMIKVQTYKDKDPDILAWDENGKSIKPKKIQNTLNEMDRLFKQSLADIEKTNND